MALTVSGTDAFTESQRGVAVLASAVLDATKLTAQLLCTVANGARVVVTQFVIRDNSFAYTGATGAPFTLQFQDSTGPVNFPLRYSQTVNTETEVSNGTVTLVNATGSLAANAGYFTAQVTGQAGAGAAAIGAPILQQNDTLTVTLAYGTGSAPAAGNTLKIDVLGYIL